jgi:hypothetical protein
MPRVRHPINRTYRFLQGRWDAIKPACSRWAATMDQVQWNPSSSVTVDEYVSEFAYFMFAQFVFGFGDYT